MYRLEKYTTPASRHTCPNCGKRRVFTMYVNDKGECLPDFVGRCDREVRCGYHFTAKQYLEANGQEYVAPLIEKKTSQPSFISTTLMEKSKRYSGNVLVDWLKGLYGEAAIDTCKKYHVGTSKHWPSSTIFWQVDTTGSVRSGKVMLYDVAGHRVKKPFPHITWIHKLIDDEKFNYTGCLFGEHLLPNDNRKVAIVESEKTAVIAAICEGEYLWLACGGLQMLNADRLAPLKNRNITLFPDAGAFTKWKEKATKLRDMGHTINTSHKLEKYPEGYDIADVYLSEGVAVQKEPLHRRIEISGQPLQRDWFSKPWNPETDRFSDIPQCWDALIGSVK
jgi:hypothetical protein